ncbi:MAG: YcfL family protein [bacterium]|nr:YcfL family protein [bacterium]
MVKKLLLFTVWCLFISACAPVTSSNVGSGQALPQGGGNYAFSNFVLINNKALLRDLQITDIKSKMVNNLMQVQVQVLNKTSRTFPFEYSFTWFDASGFQVVGVGEHWTPVIINGNEVKSLNGVAPTGEATQFKVQIRKAK